ncbi:MAG: 3-hydroxybutyryl-CoA dehydrogenase [Candidatus Cloacimonetes bacterium 4572_55]|nr:MAG: 3-hydroxybutyryl-CoA dehydrogenase [Candidatus Cloacimonetes bacterium 4572_55]
MEIGKVAIIGAGTMGEGLTEAIAAKDIDVFLFEISEDRLNHGIDMIRTNLDNKIARWGMTESEKRALLSRVHGHVGLRRTREVDVVIETIPENLEMKKELFGELERTCPPEMIFITNTSTLSISKLAEDLYEPTRLVGMHFINPVPVVPLVEIIRGMKTSEKTFDIACGFAKQLKKRTVEVFEYPGYITTRMIVTMLNEAMEIVMDGVASVKDIDTAMRLGYQFEIGPLQMADAIGLDQVLEWMQTLFRDLGDLKYRPSSLIRKMVRANKLGVKTGEGFYKYSPEGKLITK